MPTGYQINDQEGLYFVTFQIVQWIDIFTRQRYRDLFVESLIYAQKEKGLQVYGYVIMSNHVHLILKSSEGELSNTIRDLKKYTSKQFIRSIETDIESRKSWLLALFKAYAKQHSKKSVYQVWTHENHAIYLYTPKFIWQKLNYIHANPVRAGIVENPEDYLYSSARNYAGLPALFEIELIDRIFNAD